MNDPFYLIYEKLESESESIKYLRNFFDIRLFGVITHKNSMRF